MDDFIEFSPYRPDQPDYTAGATGTAQNVVPVSKTQQGLTYGPFPSFRNYASALPARCQGAYTLISDTDDPFSFAGTENGLWQLNHATRSFDDVSKTGGYNTPSSEFWDFAQFGKRVITTNFNNEIQTIVAGSTSEFEDLSSDAPRCKYVATVKQWVVAGYTIDQETQNQGIRWCAVGDPTDWPEPGTIDAQEKQAGSQILYGDHGSVQGVVSQLGSSDAAVWMESAIFRMNYSGAPYVFEFDIAEGARGTPAPHSLVRVGGLVYYLGEDGFYSFDGATSTPIGAQKVDTTFFRDVDETWIKRMVGASDPNRKLIYWAYPGSGNNGGIPNRILVYNWEVQEWSIIHTELEYMAPARTFGYTLEDLNEFGSVEDIPYSMDSRVWVDDRNILAAFDSQHEFGFMNGEPLRGTLETLELSGEPGRKLILSMSRPIVDGATQDARVSVGYRERLNQSPNYTAWADSNANNEHPHRIQDSYLRLRVRMPAGSDWDHLQGVEVETKRGSRR